MLTKIRALDLNRNWTNNLFLSNKLQRHWLAVFMACLSWYAGKSIHLDMPYGSIFTLFGQAVTSSILASLFCVLQTSLGSYRKKAKSANLINLSLKATIGALLVERLYSLDPSQNLFGHSFNALYFTWVLLWIYSQFLAHLVLCKFYKKSILVISPCVDVQLKDELIPIKDGSIENEVVCLTVDTFNKMSEKDIADFLSVNKVGAVVLNKVLSRESQLDMSKLIYPRLKNVKILSDQDLLEISDQVVNYEHLRPSWFVLSSDFNIATGFYGKVGKRLFDLVMAVSILTIFSPIMVIFAALVKFQDGGPVFYSQKRVGFEGLEFDCVKFRSMSVDAEKNGAQWATKQDSRVTKIGSFMRKSRIDELPQLFSVIKGDMSIVGPRPERLVFEKDLETHIEYYSVRHVVKPGLTGWAQIKYPYGACLEDSKNKHRYDLFYIKHLSFLMDLYILAETVSVVISREGV